MRVLIKQLRKNHEENIETKISWKESGRSETRSFPVQYLLGIKMIPVGYMAKKIATKPSWLKTDRVIDIYSVSNCVSDDFCDYVDHWKHNGYWLFDSPKIIQAVAEEHGASLEDTLLFYYEAYEYQSYEDNPVWEEFRAEESVPTNVLVPSDKALVGYDVVSFSMGNIPEHSYLSCNHMAEEIEVNKHCLLNTLEQAKELINQKAFEGCEQGPCRIFAVYRVKNA